MPLTDNQLQETITPPACISGQVWTSCASDIRAPSSQTSAVAANAQQLSGAVMHGSVEAVAHSSSNAANSLSHRNQYGTFRAGHGAPNLAAAAGGKSTCTASSSAPPADAHAGARPVEMEVMQLWCQHMLTGPRPAALLRIIQQPLRLQGAWIACNLLTVGGCAIAAATSGWTSFLTLVYMLIWNTFACGLMLFLAGRHAKRQMDMHVASMFSEVWCEHKTRTQDLHTYRQRLQAHEGLSGAEAARYKALHADRKFLDAWHTSMHDAACLGLLLPQQLSSLSQLCHACGCQNVGPVEQIQALVERPQEPTMPQLSEALAAESAMISAVRAGVATDAALGPDYMLGRMYHEHAAAHATMDAADSAPLIPTVAADWGPGTEALAQDAARFGLIADTITVNVSHETTDESYARDSTSAGIAADAANAVAPANLLQPSSHESKRQMESCLGVTPCGRRGYKI